MREKLKKFFKNKEKRRLLLYVLILGALLIAYTQYTASKKPEEVSITTFINLMETKKVKKMDDIVILEDSRVIRYTLEKQAYEVKYPVNYISQNEELLKTFATYKKEISFEKSGFYTFMVFGEIARIFIIILLIYFLYRMMQGSLTPFNAEEVKDEKVTFKDIAGYRYVKEEMEDIVDFLNNPEDYRKFTERPPKGILFEGPPGNGKTLFAKAIAGETNTPFFQISASDIEDMFVGSGARRLEKVFKRVKNCAKESGRAILFIDEIDAVGMKRESRTVVETNQTINKLLTEMDGFDKETNVLIIGATNLAAVLDPALVRSGRFDRTLTIPLPSRKDREEVLDLYLRQKGEVVHAEVYEEGYIQTLSLQTEGFSNADMAKLVNDAALLAKKDEKETIDIESLRKSFTRTIAGVKMEHELTAEDHKIIAYHEAGHAVMQILTSPLGYRGVAYITVTPHGQSLGHVVRVAQNAVLKKRSDLENEIKVMLAGRAVEDILLRGNPTTGAASDLQQANQRLVSYVKDYGLSANLENLFMEKFDESNQTIQKEIKELRDSIYMQTKGTVQQHFDMVTAIAEYLLQHETIDQHQIPQILQGTSYEEFEKKTHRE